jgi:hypothetical protein
MSDTEDRPKPPESSEPKKESEVWIPPRLRAKIEEAESDEEPTQKSPVGTIVGVVVLVLILSAGGWLVVTNVAKAKAKKLAEEAAAAAQAAAVADSIQRVHVADSLAVVARADSIAAFMKLPKWQQNKILGIKSPEETDPTEPGNFVIDAGSYMFDTPANAAAEALKPTTKLSVRVVPVGTGDDMSYHVYVGQFGVRGDADAAAKTLIAGGVARQAKVVTVPKGK